VEFMGCTFLVRREFTVETNGEDMNLDEDTEMKTAAVTAALRVVDATTHAEALRELRTRWAGIVNELHLGDSFDGDFDTLDEVIEGLEATMHLAERCGELSLQLAAARLNAEAIETAVLAEREACAAILDQRFYSGLAGIIRTRDEAPEKATRIICRGIKKGNPA